MNVQRFLFKMSCGLVPALLVAGCATVDSVKSPDASAPVRKVDFRQSPELKELAAHARQFGDKIYPQVCALLLDENSVPPPQFDLILKSLKSRNTGEAHLAVKRIYLNTDYLTNNAELPERFDKVFVHEMAHMAVQYQPWIKTLWQSDSPAAGYWGESIADYAFYKLIGTNGWSCPECNARYPHYTSGYTCGGAFLLYLDATGNTNLVRQLARELRDRTFKEEFFQNATGRSLAESWTDFQITPAFKPTAAEAFQLQAALGYENGVPPKDAVKRFKKYVEHHADDFTKATLRQPMSGEHGLTDMRDLITAYGYLAQPGGSAEQAWMNLRETGNTPGFIKGEKGAVVVYLDSEAIASQNYPITRTFECRKQNDTTLYHYAMVRATPERGWKLTKAWRAAPDGKIIEEFAVP